MRKRVIQNIFIITLIFIILIISIITISMTISISKHKNDKYYIIGNDKIPTIYKVVGNRSISMYKIYSDNGIEKIKCKYTNINNVSSDLANFINDLKNNNGFVFTSDVDLKKQQGTIQLSSNSVDKDKIIIVDINYKRNKYEIIISKGKGIINLY